MTTTAPIGSIRVSECGAYRPGVYTIETLCYPPCGDADWAVPASCFFIGQHFPTREAAINAICDALIAGDLYCDNNGIYRA